jgi:hypothetical protein
LDEYLNSVNNDEFFDSIKVNLDSNIYLNDEKPTKKESKFYFFLVVGQQKKY